MLPERFIQFASGGDVQHDVPHGAQPLDLRLTQSARGIVDGTSPFEPQHRAAERPYWAQTRPTAFDQSLPLLESAGFGWQRRTSRHSLIGTNRIAGTTVVAGPGAVINWHRDSVLPEWNGNGIGTGVPGSMVAITVYLAFSIRHRWQQNSETQLPPCLKDRQE